MDETKSSEESEHFEAVAATTILMTTPWGGGGRVDLPPQILKVGKNFQRKLSKSVGYTFRLRNYIRIPHMSLSYNIFRAGAANTHYKSFITLSSFSFSWST